mgnify:FL=1
MNCFVLSDSPLFNTDLTSIAACFDNNSVVLDREHDTNDSAVCNDLVTYLKVISHLSVFLILLFLRTDNKEVEEAINNLKGN